MQAAGALAELGDVTAGGLGASASAGGAATDGAGPESKSAFEGAEGSSMRLHAQPNKRQLKVAASRLGRCMASFYRGSCFRTKVGLCGNYKIIQQIPALGPVERVRKKVGGDVDLPGGWSS
jgi:hypothetical protein